MDQQLSNQSGTGATTVERTSDRELVVTRTFDAPAHIVFKAWSQAELFRQWWVPEGAGISLVACDMDVRTGGNYRLEFGAGDQTMAFYGKYLEVVPDERIVWTNDEGEEGAVTTVTFERQGAKTLRPSTNSIRPAKRSTKRCRARPPGCRRSSTSWARCWRVWAGKAGSPRSIRLFRRKSADTRIHFGRATKRPCKSFDISSNGARFDNREASAATCHCKSFISSGCARRTRGRLCCLRWRVILRSQEAGR